MDYCYPGFIAFMGLFIFFAILGGPRGFDSSPWGIFVYFAVLAWVFFESLPGKRHSYFGVFKKPVRLGDLPGLNPRWRYCLQCYRPLREGRARSTVQCPACGFINSRMLWERYWTRAPLAVWLQKWIKWIFIAAVLAGCTLYALFRGRFDFFILWFFCMPPILATSSWDPFTAFTERQRSARNGIFWGVFILIGGFLLTMRFGVMGRPIIAISIAVGAGIFSMSCLLSRFWFPRLQQKIINRAQGKEDAKEAAPMLVRRGDRDPHLPGSGRDPAA